MMTTTSMTTTMTTKMTTTMTTMAKFTRMMTMKMTAYQVHDKGEEGKGGREQRVGVKELYRQVQARVSDKSR